MLLPYDTLKQTQQRQKHFCRKTQPASSRSALVKKRDLFKKSRQDFRTYNPDAHFFPVFYCFLREQVPDQVLKILHTDVVCVSVSYIHTYILHTYTYLHSYIHTNKPKRDNTIKPTKCTMIKTYLT